MQHVPKVDSYYFDKRKDTDSKLIKNWIPVSLSNVDVKVSLAERMKKVIHHVIQWDQIVYIKGEPIGLIDDLLIYCAEHKNLDGNTFTANMRKALHSVEHDLTLISPEGGRNPPTAMLFPLLC